MNRVKEQAKAFANTSVTENTTTICKKRVNAFCRSITMPDRTMTTESVIN